MPGNSRKRKDKKPLKPPHNRHGHRLHRAIVTGQHISIGGVVIASAVQEQHEEGDPERRGAAIAYNYGEDESAAHGPGEDSLDEDLQDYLENVQQQDDPGDESGQGSGQAHGSQQRSRRASPASLKALERFAALSVEGHDGDQLDDLALRAAGASEDSGSLSSSSCSDDASSSSDDASSSSRGSQAGREDQDQADLGDAAGGMLVDAHGRGIMAMASLTMAERYPVQCKQQLLAELQQGQQGLHRGKQKSAVRGAGGGKLRPGEKQQQKREQKLARRAARDARRGFDLLQLDRQMALLVEQDGDMAALPLATLGLAKGKAKHGLEVVRKLASLYGLRCSFQGGGSSQRLVLTRTPGTRPSAEQLRSVQQYVIHQLALQQRGAAAGAGVGPAGMAAASPPAGAAAAAGAARRRSSGRAGDRPQLQQQQQAGLGSFSRPVAFVAAQQPQLDDAGSEEVQVVLPKQDQQQPGLGQGQGQGTWDLPKGLQNQPEASSSSSGSGSRSRAAGPAMEEGAVAAQEEEEEEEEVAHEDDDAWPSYGGLGLGAVRSTQQQQQQPTGGEEDDLRALSHFGLGFRPQGFAPAASGSGAGEGRSSPAAHPSGVFSGLGFTRAQQGYDAQALPASHDAAPVEVQGAAGWSGTAGAAGAAAITGATGATGAAGAAGATGAAGAAGAAGAGEAAGQGASGQLTGSSAVVFERSSFSLGLGLGSAAAFEDDVSTDTGGRQAEGDLLELRARLQARARAQAELHSAGGSSGSSDADGSSSSSEGASAGAGGGGGPSSAFGRSTSSAAGAGAEAGRSSGRRASRAQLSAARQMSIRHATPHGLLAALMAGYDDEGPELLVPEDPEAALRTLGLTARQQKQREKKRVKEMRRQARAQGMSEDDIAALPHSAGGKAKGRHSGRAVGWAAVEGDVGLQQQVGQAAGFAAFEQHSSGIGSRLMQRMGWNLGEGLGRAKQGMPEPLAAVMHPKNRGLGA